MSSDPKDLYLDLMKKALTDYLNIDSSYANGMSPEFWWSKSPLKDFRNRLIVKLLRRSHMLVMRSDRLTTEQRRENRRVGSDWPFMNAQTMIGLERLDNIQNLVEDALARGVEGDLIETGVWRGGACIFMRAILKSRNIQDRRIWACDSFEGLPTPDTERYPADKGTGFHHLNFLAVSQEEVAANFEKYDLLDDQVKFVKGYFEDTLAHVPVEKLALMRLDGDQYGSTITALENLYPKLSCGGYVIVDDFHLDCCRSAVNDYRSAHSITDEIINIDGLGAYWQKT